MNFEIISDITATHQYDEIKIIGKEICLHGKPYHFAAMVRKAEQAQLFVLGRTSRDDRSDEELLNGHSERWGQTMREQMKAEDSGSFSFLSKLKTESGELEFSSAQSGSLEPVSQDDFEKTLLFAKLMDAGWNLTKDSVFFEESWKYLECQQYEFQVPLRKLPQWEYVSAVWQPQWKKYFVEKPVRLLLEDAQTGNVAQAQISFSIPGENGEMRDGICYINHVKRADVWQEQKEIFENPVFRKNASEHMTSEEFEDMQRTTWESLEQACPRGMYFVCVEYECTLDVNLQFYASDYLNSRPDAPNNHASSMVFLAKPDVPEGMHGLKMKAHMIQVPVTKDRKELEAELFEVFETFPEQEAVLC